MGKSDSKKNLQGTCSNVGEAQQYAETEFKQLERDTAQLSYRVASGGSDPHPSR